MDQFMERAVELSLQNVREGGQPFGAVLVKGGEIIAEGVNELHKVQDVSGHAEMLAIRRAQQELNVDSLAGSIMYASGEPCPMCLSAMYLAGIETAYYCASLEETVQAGLGKSKIIYEDLQKPASERRLSMAQMPLAENQDNPVELWMQRSNKA
ncbi:nucleoside deaminase [Planococcus glaciei]|uniref:Nucleoside deaminase n=1 Tax=Planococcus glaciei TaxID=459472 RepID=A0A7H8Q9N7_9BACL|nr:nucleoside deaminase [Planococcus glaciei]QDY45264.1 nucleoside deaminase [Planococcus glaciei]QKX50201.1 nucleoside deaminase [Planococcus glaciei]